MDPSAAQPHAEAEKRRRVSLEAIGEIILLTIVGAFFIYLFVASLDWPLGAALVPWISVAIGFPFWIYRLVVLFLRVQEAPRQIMDMGFRIGTDPGGERARFFRISIFILGLYLAIWLFGFHLALPAGIFLYTFLYGQTSWWWSLCLSLFFLTLIIAVYDQMLGAVWHEPPALQWLYAIFQP